MPALDRCPWILGAKIFGVIANVQFSKTITMMSLKTGTLRILLLSNPS
jgi:hypothetical protein